jgi:hypothetical protein
VNNVDRANFRCFFHLSQFEIYFAYFTQSNGALHKEKCFEAAKRFRRSYKEMVRHGGKVGTLINQNKEIEKGWPVFDQWLSGKSDLEQIWRIRYFATEVKAAILKAAQIGKWNITLSSKEKLYTADYLRWKAHLPERSMGSRSPNEIIEGFNQSNSITIVGDIRRSQDLMMFEGHPGFARFMSAFIREVRKVLQEHIAVLDKFTGDGFVAFINEDICAQRKHSMYKVFADCVGALHSRTNEIFEQWVATLQRIPPDPIGLAIGADIGVVRLSLLEDHLISESQSVVWATRVCEQVGAGRVGVNNRLRADLMQYEPGIMYKPVDSQTKAGDRFRWFELNQ